MYREYIRLLGILRPRMFIFENVTGYHIHQKVLNAKNFGVPQSRDRVFMVSIRNDLDRNCWNFPEEMYGERRGKLPYLTVEDAISDLPHLNEGEAAENYAMHSQNDYQTLMRNGYIRITEHFIGVYGDKIRTVIENVVQGEGWTIYKFLGISRIFLTVRLSQQL